MKKRAGGKIMHGIHLRRGYGGQEIINIGLSGWRGDGQEEPPMLLPVRPSLKPTFSYPGWTPSLRWIWLPLVDFFNAAVAELDADQPGYRNHLLTNFRMLRAGDDKKLVRQPPVSVNIPTAVTPGNRLRFIQARESIRASARILKLHRVNDTLRNCV